MHRFFFFVRKNTLETATAKEQNNKWILALRISLSIFTQKGSCWYQFQISCFSCSVFSSLYSHEQWWMCLRTCHGASLGYFTILKGRNKQHSLFAFSLFTQLNTHLKNFLCEGFWMVSFYTDSISLMDSGVYLINIWVH